MILVGFSTGLDIRSVEIGGFHTVQTDQGPQTLQCLWADETEAVFRHGEGRLVIPQAEWLTRIADLRGDTRGDFPCDRQTNPEIANMFRIAARWERGHSPTEAEIDKTYEQLPGVMDLLADLQDMVRRRDAHIARLTGNPIQDSLA